METSPHPSPAAAGFAAVKGGALCEAVPGSCPALTVINPNGSVQRVQLTRWPFLIGRQADNDLVLRDNRISRAHAKLHFDGSACSIEDLGSRHGVFVNGFRLEGTQPLHPGDTISFGFADTFQLEFQWDRRAEPLMKSLPGAVDPAQSAMGKLRALVDVARAVHGSLSVQEVLEAIVEAALNVTSSQRGFLLLGKGEALETRVARDSAGKRVPATTVPPALIARALAARSGLLSTVGEGILPGDSLCVPLVQVRTEVSEATMVATTPELLGAIYLEAVPAAPNEDGGSLRDLLHTLAIEASTVLENARLLEQEQEKQALEGELRIARTIQQTLLPDKLPDTGWFRVAASAIPSQQVGGDYYDVRPIGEDCWAIVVADVSGKGVSSALLASLLQGAFLTGASDPEAISSLLVRINEYLFQRAEGEKYATVFYAAVHRDGTVHWANAGLPAPYVVRARGGLEPLRATATPLGMLDGMPYQVETARLHQGDQIVAFSDGVTEAQDPAGNFFETRRVREFLTDNPGSDAGQTHRQFIARLREFTRHAPQRDDLTLLAASYHGAESLS